MTSTPNRLGETWITYERADGEQIANDGVVRLTYAPSPPAKGEHEE